MSSYRVSARCVYSWDIEAENEEVALASAMRNSPQIAIDLTEDHTNGYLSVDSDYGNDDVAVAIEYVVGETCRKD